MSQKGQWLKYTEGAVEVVGCSSYLSHRWDKEPDKKQCKRKGLDWLTVRGDRERKGMAAEQEAAGHTASTTRKQRAKEMEPD